MDIGILFARLKRSKFRASFHVSGKDRSYLERIGSTKVLEHAHRFIVDRLSQAYPLNDGSQTPMKGHPVFVAQHATATCCRGCIQKWHGIKTGRQLAESEIQYLVAVISRWLNMEFGAERIRPSAMNVKLRPGKQKQLSLFEGE